MLLMLLKRHGWNATSFQVLEPGLDYWFDDADAPDAAIAYRDTGQAWVVAGAPLTSPERFAEVTARFADEAARAHRRICFFATERRFADAIPWASRPIGEQPVWDPSAWEVVLASSRSLREQLRRSRARGVTVRLAAAEEYSAGSPLRQDMEALIERWLRQRSLAPMGFLVQVHPFDFSRERRLLVAEDGEGMLLGFLAMVPIYAREGWLIEDLLRDTHSPNGTAELLVDAAMRQAAASGSRYVTLGLAPLSGRVGRWLRLARDAGARFYSFEGLRAFKARLRPGHWEPIYLTFPPGQGFPLSLFDALAAFAPQGLPRFLVETLLRNPTLPLRALAVLLIPWTLLLALADGAWFPASWAQWGWVAFDTGLLAGFYALSRRWRDGLATLMACLVTGDALVTLVEVLRFNAPRVRNPLEAIWLAVAVLGPALAAAFLWAARQRQRELASAGRPDAANTMCLRR